MIVKLYVLPKPWSSVLMQRGNMGLQSMACEVFVGNQIKEKSVQFNLQKRAEYVSLHSIYLKIVEAHNNGTSCTLY